MTSAEFKQAFPGESSLVEFKKGVSRDEVQNSAVAFSNADGGVILIGVRDDGEVAGRALDAGTVDDISQSLQMARDVGRYGITQFDVDGKPVCVVSVARRREGFAQTSGGVVRVRRGTRDDPLFGLELVRFATERTPTRYETTSSGAPLTAADAALRRDIGQALGWAKATPAAMRDAGLAIGDELTVAGALFVLRDPTQVLGKAFVEVLRYPDDSTVDYDRRRDLTGPVHEVLQRAVDEVVDELGAELVVLGATRYELPRLPVVVVREAIANALGHRSYETSGTAVRVEIRPNVVVIRSPGGLPEPVTVENIRETRLS